MNMRSLASVGSLHPTKNPHTIASCSSSSTSSSSSSSSPSSSCSVCLSYRVSSAFATTSSNSGSPRAVQSSSTSYATTSTTTATPTSSTSRSARVDSTSVPPRSSSSSRASPLLLSFKSSLVGVSAGHLSLRGVGGAKDFSRTSIRTLVKVTARRHQRADEPEPDADGTLAFPLLREDVVPYWWPMRSRPMAENSYKRLPSREMPTEADRVRAKAAYLAYEVPEYVASSPPWQLSLPHVCIATIASILFGYHLGVVNVPLDYIAHDLGFAGNALAQGSLVSSCLVGAFAGCSTSGSVADKYGRRRSFQISTVPMILGSILSALAPSLSVMLLGRLLVGIGLGIAGPVAALYVSEISPTAVRGTYGSLLQVATCVGILGAILAGLPVASIPGWWRACFWISTIPAALLAVGMEYCAESPRWLFKASKWLEAEHELERLWGTEHSKTAMADLVRGEDSNEGGDATWATLLDPKYFKVVCIGATLFAFQQLAGINAVFYFSTVVFKNAGVSSSIAASVSMGVVNLLASGVATFLMDKQGRRNLMICSFTGMALAMNLQAAAAGLAVLAPYQGALSLVATLSYVFMFALGAGPVPALLLPELFASRIRAKAMSVAMCVHWVVNFLVGLFFLQLLQQLGASTVYCFFSAVCLVAAVFVKKNVIETKGRSLEEIEIMLLSDDA